MKAAIKEGKIKNEMSKKIKVTQRIINVRRPKNKAYAIGPRRNGANNIYRISPIGGESIDVRFQVGDPRTDLNGIDDQSLLAITRDRMQDWKAAGLGSWHTSLVLAGLWVAEWAISRRTTARIAAAVEGKFAPGPGVTAA